MGSQPRQMPDFLRAEVKRRERQQELMARLLAEHWKRSPSEHSGSEAEFRELAEHLATIVGGWETASGELPECCAVGIREFPKWVGSGTLIDRWVVATAG